MTQACSINRSFHNPKGFTLVELITTMVLIGILAVSVAPKFLGPSSFSSYAVRNEFIGFLRQIQQRAINNTDQCFQVFVDAQGYEALVSNQNPAGICSTYSRLVRHGWADNAQVQLNNSSTFNIIFNKSGEFNFDMTIMVRTGDTSEIKITQAGYIYAP